MEKDSESNKDNYYYCNSCERQLKIYNKYRHEKSKKHITNIKNDCIICLSTTKIIHFLDCSECKQKWCRDCDKKITKCPYCRKELPEKTELIRQRQQESLEEYERELFENYVLNLTEEEYITDLLLISMIINITLNT